MAKAAGAACNMRCDYCYYLDKERLYKQDEDPTPRTMMPEDFLERYIRQYIEAQPKDIPVTFTWHGGEALLRPLSFYRKAIELQQLDATHHALESREARDRPAVAVVHLLSPV